jgi:molybdopterin synthase catalytic subunit
VKTLFYEAYDTMALKELQKLAEKAVKDFDL